MANPAMIVSGRPLASLARKSLTTHNVPHNAPEMAAQSDAGEGRR